VEYLALAKFWPISSETDDLAIFRDQAAIGLMGKQQLA